MRRGLRSLLPLAVGFQLLAGCLMPSGTPVFVERRTGDYWSGKGVLLEVTEDRLQCRVAVRDTALFVEKKWVPCKYVHVRTVRR